MSAKPFRLGTSTLAPGERKTVDLPVSALSNHTPLTLPVHVVHGEKAGPVLFLSAVVHGDEILGAEIVRRVIRHRALHGLSGTLLAVPVVNAFGLLSHSRYMPDRRDLNRSFPGSDHGSLASIVADLFMREVVLTGTGHRLRDHPWRIAGKTGTAELSGKPSHSWFVGFAPYGTAVKRIAFAIIVENAGYGGASAAPAAGEIVTAAAAAGLIK